MLAGFLRGQNIDVLGCPQVPMVVRLQIFVADLPRCCYCCLSSGLSDIPRRNSKLSMHLSTWPVTLRRRCVLQFILYLDIANEYQLCSEATGNDSEEYLLRTTLLPAAISSRICHGSGDSSSPNSVDRNGCPPVNQHEYRFRWL